MEPNDPALFEAYAESHPVGTQVLAPVEDVQPFGAFCQLADGVQGLLLVVDFGGMPKRFSFPSDYPRVGDVVESTIVLVDREQLKIRLSQRVR